MGVASRRVYSIITKMSKKSRTILFVFCLISFLIAGPLAIFYSQGFRIDFERKKIVQVGGLFLKVVPKNAVISVYPIKDLSLNRENEIKKETALSSLSVKKTDFITGTALFKALLPKKYLITVQKQGFLPWQKVLEIKEKQVTEIKNIILMPENPDFKKIYEDAENFFFSPDQKKFIIKKNRSHSSIDEKKWNLIIDNLKKQEFLFSENSEKKFLNLKWSFDSEKILLETQGKKKRNFSIIDIRSKKINFLDFSKRDIKEIFFHPQNSNKILFVSYNNSELKTSSPAKTPTPRPRPDLNNLYEIDYLNPKSQEQIILNDFLTCGILKNELIWLNKKGFLYRSDFKNLVSGENLDSPPLPGFKKNIPETLNSQPFPVKEKSQYSLISFNSNIFLKEDDNWYHFNNQTKNLENFGKKIKNLKISPDLKKIVFLNDYDKTGDYGNEIWISFLKPEKEQPEKKVNERVFINRFSKKIGDVFWLNSHYLVFNPENQIKISEIDDRDKLNIVNLPLPDVLNEKYIKSIFYNQKNKKLYLLINDEIYVSKELIQ